MGRPARPRWLGLTLIPVFMAATAIVGAVVLLRSARSTPSDATIPANGSLTTERTTAVERAWIDEALAASYVPAPPAPALCAQRLRNVAESDRRRIAAALRLERDERVARLGELVRPGSGDWPAVLSLAAILLEADRADLALPLLDEQIREPRFVRQVQEALDAARSEQHDRGPSSEDLLAAIHLLHADGYARILQNQSGGQLWASLKHPIGCAKLWLLRQERARLSSPSTAAEVSLPSPGCPPSPDDLTTYDLYNNLIVGYLANPDFSESKGRRDHEFRRDYRDAAKVNPLQAVLTAAVAHWDPDREHWVWALSNAERLMRDRRWQRGIAPRDVRLSLNLAQLLESALEQTPPEAQAAMLDWISQLTGEAWERKDELPDFRRGALDPPLVRMILIEASRSGRALKVPERMLENLSPEGSAAAEAILQAVALRENPHEWLRVVRTHDRSALRVLGGRDAWLSASRSDLAAWFARQGIGAEERPEYARLSRSLLMFGDEHPPELREIEEGLGWPPERVLFFLSSSTPLRAATIAVSAVLAWLAGWLLSLQLRRWKSLYTSFYRLDAERQFRTGR